MDMVRRAVDDQSRPLAFSDNAAHIREKPGSQFGRQVRRTVPAGEDDVHEQTSEGMWHALTPLSGATATGHSSPTASAVGYFLSPFGLGTECTGKLTILKGKLGIGTT
jgi:hypothetical protein